MQQWPDRTNDNSLTVQSVFRAVRIVEPVALVLIKMQKCNCNDEHLKGTVARYKGFTC